MIKNTCYAYILIDLCPAALRNKFANAIMAYRIAEKGTSNSISFLSKHLWKLWPNEFYKQYQIWK